MEKTETFTASVTYVQPSFEELKRQFPSYVDPGYQGKRFDPIERCKGISKKSRDIAFEYVHLDRDASIDEVRAEMDRRGLRPALYEELLGFAEKYPQEGDVAAIGSRTSVFDGDLFPKFYDYRPLGCALYLIREINSWHPGECILAVRK